jgi:hypothetical protein
MSSKNSFGWILVVAVIFAMFPVTARCADWQTSPFRAQVAGAPSSGQTTPDPATSPDSPVPFNPKKNIGKAALFSLILPGTGELYAGSWMRAIPFFAIEVACWATFASYQSQGNKKTDEFEKFAGTRTNPNNFDYRTYLWAEYSMAKDDARNGTAGAYPANFESWSGLDWDARIEYLPPPFTHDILTLDQQQYFEMIGKYFSQFAFGWKDTYNDGAGYASAVFTETSPWEVWTRPAAGVSPDDPNTVAYDGGSPMFYHYRDMRGKANDLYHVGNIAIEVVLVNHILSALDAALAARSYNKHLESGDQSKPLGGLKLQYNAQASNGDVARYLTLALPLN